MSSEYSHFHKSRAHKSRAHKSRAHKSRAQAEAILLKVIQQNKGGAAACIQALGVICFVTSTEDSDTWSCIDLLEKDMTAMIAITGQSRLDVKGGKSTKAKPSARVDARDRLVSACVAWGLLATTVGKKWLATFGFHRFVPLFHALLEHDSLSVKTAAGENLALLCEAQGGVSALGGTIAMDDWSTSDQSAEEEYNEGERVGRGGRVGRGLVGAQASGDSDGIVRTSTV